MKSPVVVSNRSGYGEAMANAQSSLSLAIGKRHLPSLYRHPKLVDLATGKIVHVRTALRSGQQDGESDGSRSAPMMTARNRRPCGWPPMTSIAVRRMT